MSNRARQPTERPRRREEGGFTLIELLVAMTAMLAVGGMIMTMLVIGMRAEPKITARSQRVTEARQVLERVTRELRQTYSVRATGSAEIDILAYLRSGGSTTAAERRVLYQCTSGTCYRSEAAPDQAFEGSGVKVVGGLANADIFSYEPDTINPEFVRVKFVFSIEGQTNPVTLTDGVNLRNATSFDD